MIENTLKRRRNEEKLKNCEELMEKLPQISENTLFSIELSKEGEGVCKTLNMWLEYKKY